MPNNLIDETTIKKIAAGNEYAFSQLYDCYYTYLNTIALYYIFDRNAANEVVNDVFINVWHKRSTLIYPIQAYLVQSVRNRCLNYIRSLQSESQMLNEHKKQLLNFQEEHILSNPSPLQYFEAKEIEKAVNSAVLQLPERCRLIFEQYFYSGKRPEEIASDLSLNVNTVRVQIKNALDKLKASLRYLTFWLLLLFIK